MSIRDRSVLTNAGITMESMYRSAILPLQQDCYRDNYMWPAKVVSPPNPASSKDLYALQNANANLEEGVSPITPKFTFRAYILNQGSPQKCQSPHAFFEDPCSLRDSASPECVRQLIQNCIMVTSPESYAGPTPQVGDTVTIMLHQADQHGAYDLQFAKLVSVANSSIRESTNFDTQVACQNLQDFFDEAEASPSSPPVPQGTPNQTPAPDPPPPAPPAAIGTFPAPLGSAGDSWKATQAEKLASLHPDLRPRVEAIMADLRSQGYDPVINFGWRTIQEQRWLMSQRLSTVPFSFHNTLDSQGRPAAQAADIVDAAMYRNDEDRMLTGRGPPGGNAAFWTALSIAAAAQGFTGKQYGGNWTGFGQFGDAPHVEIYPDPAATSQASALRQAKTTTLAQLGVSSPSEVV